MAMVKHTHLAGKKLSAVQIARIMEAAKFPITYDKDCPELTEQQLSEFKPVNFSNMTERASVMKIGFEKVRIKHELATV
ncbi:MAG: hypothetical protein Ta2B_05450 [Termitinemataceae bacterium]|nr:MAG: hypothetical protein Ta2B_05450 [Termitinemataceae bacterium]